MNTFSIRMKKISKLAFFTLLGMSLCILAFGQFSTGQTRLRAQRHQSRLQNFSAPSEPTQFGDALPGLTTNQLAAFGVGHMQDRALAPGFPDPPRTPPSGVPKFDTTAQGCRLANSAAC